MTSNARVSFTTTKRGNAATQQEVFDGLPERNTPITPRGSQFDQPAAQAARDGFGASCGAEFSENRADVKLDRVLGNAQLCGDVFIAEAVCQQSQNFDFPWCELFGRRLIAGVLRHQRAVENGQTGGDRFDGVHDLVA